MAKTFEGSISQWVAKSERAVEAVFKQSAQEIAEDANTPTARGGRMRVDTGFLRNSQSADLNSRPSGPSDPDTENQGNPEQVSLVIAGARTSDTIYVGWTANYARYREARDGFAEGAAKKWPAIVRRNSARIRRLGR